MGAESEGPGTALASWESRPICKQVKNQYIQINRSRDWRACIRCLSHVLSDFWPHFALPDEESHLGRKGPALNPGRVAIIGAGPAGLTAAYLLTKEKVSTVVLEGDPQYVGGISKTATY